MQSPSPSPTGNNMNRGEKLYEMGGKKFRSLKKKLSEERGSYLEPTQKRSCNDTNFHRKPTSGEITLRNIG